MSTASDRRAPGTARIPFDAMVEVGGALGPSFEAQAVNLSEEGMSLRTAYLPEVGQPVMCRFEAGYGLSVVAAGEVIWKEDMGNGGEFGIRFTNIDGSSTVALQRILGLAEEGNLPRSPQGRKVRLHIEGLASPMRARVKDQKDHAVTAYSELGFLQVGKPLDLEDATSGSRRPAMIDGVAVEIDEVDRIPQLVVTLRYDDTDARNAVARMENEIPVDEGQVKEPTPAPDAVEEPAVASVAASATPATEEEDDEAMTDEESKKLKGAFARNAAKITPAITSWAKRAKTTIALLAAKARRRGEEAEVPVRRTTAPAPGGGLHAAGRKVIRGSIDDGMGIDEEPPKPKLKITKKKAIAIGAIGAATILAFVALRKPAPAPQLAAAPPADGTSAATAQQTGAAPTATTTYDPLAAAAAVAQASGYQPGMVAGKAVPFSNGPVGSRGNVIKIKMDGKIERIEGASQPTGFTVVIPGRRSMDSAAPLASKDSRIAALRVANEPTGAELAVTFKDGVPNYQVRANGNVLELVLARPSHENAGAHAKKKPAKKKH